MRYPGKTGNHPISGSAHFKLQNLRNASYYKHNDHKRKTYVIQNKKFLKFRFFCKLHSFTEIYSGPDYSLPCPRSEPLLKVPVYRTAFCKYHESVRVYAADDPFYLRHFIFGDQDEQDIGCLICVGSFSVPICHASPRLLHNSLRNACLLCKYHNAHIYVLDMYPVDGKRQHGRIDEGVHHDLYIEQEQADSIHKDIHKNIDSDIS